MEFQTQFKPIDFKQMKKDLKLTNKDIANIIGTGETNVKNQTAPNKKKIATWANSMLYVYHRLKQEAEVLKTDTQEFLDEK
jgi:hypothetical protein